MDGNFGGWLESNPGLIQAKSILGGAMAGFVPAGTSVMFGGDTAPTGWVLEDGSIYDAVTNPGLYLNLWSVIGTKYGGTGQSAFKVPDSRGRVGVGLGTHADISTLGNNEGNAVANRSVLHTMSNNLSGGTTGSTSAGTPAGTISTVVTNVSTDTVGDSSDGSGGTNKVVSLNLTTAVPAFTGSAMSGHTHTQGAPGGTIGLTTGAARPVNGPAYIVKNWIMKL